MSQSAFVPYGGYISTPFAKWQGSLAHLHSMKLAAHLVRALLQKRSWEPSIFDFAVLGITVLQKQSFYGLPWLTGMIGAEHVAGPTISQACATSARILAAAAAEVQSGLGSCALAVATDRTSNGPHVYYPNPRGMGGTGDHEDVVVDNFGHDPHAQNSMLQTAENVAKKWGVTTTEQHEVALRRFEQYQAALEDDSAFLKRFMPLPYAVPDEHLRRLVGEMTGDEGIFPTTREGLAKLKPVQKEGGTVTFGGQTHPADGAAAMIVTTEEKARELSSDPKIRVRLAGFGQARTERGFMPAATVPAARVALSQAGIGIADVAAIKSHNPFAVNDIVFARELGIDVMTMNNYGSSLVWGHPQGPTGLRATIELIEELAIRGGGYGLFQGCAAGDSAMALVVEVTDASRAA